MKSFCNFGCYYVTLLLYNFKVAFSATNSFIDVDIFRIAGIFLPRLKLCFSRWMWHLQIRNFSGFFYFSPNVFKIFMVRVLHLSQRVREILGRYSHGPKILLATYKKIFTVLSCIFILLMLLLDYSIRYFLHSNGFYCFQSFFITWNEPV